MFALACSLIFLPRLAAATFATCSGDFGLRIFTFDSSLRFFPRFALAFFARCSAVWTRPSAFSRIR
jgi:hypothetical protein